MKTLSCAEASANLSHEIDLVNKNGRPLKITRPGRAAGVLISLDEYESYEETLYLLQSAANATALHQSQKEYEAGEFVEVDFYLAGTRPTRR